MAAYALTGVHGIFGASFVAGGTALFLLGAAGAPAGWSARSRVAGAVRWFGRHSYELYLFHIVVLGLMRTVLPRGAVGDAWKPLWLALFLALSALLAWLVARFFSDPGNRSLRGLLDRRRDAAPAADQRLARGA
jgi:peptidoglycan/LPS O-acetylase OafA/YrhL